MPVPTGDQLKAARAAAGLSQAQAAELMGYPLQTGSRGGVQSRTWQALESMSDERNMQGPVYAMFLLLTGQHPRLCAGGAPGGRRRHRHRHRLTSTQTRTP